MVFSKTVCGDLINKGPIACQQKTNRPNLARAKGGSSRYHALSLH
jgi:hypothetical protein